MALHQTEINSSAEQFDNMAAFIEDLRNAGHVRAASYRINGALGQGKFATVYRAERDGKPYALKRMAIFGQAMSASSREKCLREIMLLRTLHHPCIIRYEDSFIEPDSDDLVIVLQWARGGDLKRIIRKLRSNDEATSNTLRHGGEPLQQLSPTHFSESQIWRYAYEIAAGLSYMHRARVAHRDLKPANIMLSGENHVLLGDLGLSRYFSPHTMEAFTKVGTPLYLAPDVINGNGYSFSADVWSLGVILYECACLVSPFKPSTPGVNLFKLFSAIKIGQYRPIRDAAKASYSIQLQDMVSSMLQLDPLVRPSIDEILRICCRHVDPSSVVPSPTEALASIDQTSIEMQISHLDPIVRVPAIERFQSSAEILDLKSDRPAVLSARSGITVTELSSPKTVDNALGSSKLLQHPQSALPTSAKHYHKKNDEHSVVPSKTTSAVKPVVVKNLSQRDATHFSRSVSAAPAQLNQSSTTLMSHVQRIADVPASLIQISDEPEDVLNEVLISKLQLLHYERDFCRVYHFPWLHRQSFVSSRRTLSARVSGQTHKATGNPWIYFSSLVIWLIQLHSVESCTKLQSCLDAAEYGNDRHSFINMVLESIRAARIVFDTGNLDLFQLEQGRGCSALRLLLALTDSALHKYHIDIHPPRHDRVDFVSAASEVCIDSEDSSTSVTDPFLYASEDDDDERNSVSLRPTSQSHIKHDHVASKDDNKYSNVENWLREYRILEERGSFHIRYRSSISKPTWWHAITVAQAHLLSFEKYNEVLHMVRKLAATSNDKIHRISKFEHKLQHTLVHMQSAVFITQRQSSIILEVQEQFLDSIQQATEKIIHLEALKDELNHEIITLSNRLENRNRVSLLTKTLNGMQTEIKQLNLRIEVCIETIKRFKQDSLIIRKMNATCLS